jgi:hydroxymethylglutaryl-CoA reductase
MDIQSAEQLSRVIAAVGLAQNFSALKALATEGIQKGHMSLHSQNIALMAGAQGDEIARVARRLVELGTVRIDIAEAELKKLRDGGV